MKKDWDAAEERTQDQLALMEDDDIDEWLAMDSSSETTPIASSRATSAVTEVDECCCKRLNEGLVWGKSEVAA
nr:1-aminocyclopropane-1-carboxylate synthase 11-like [Ipomoea batatas]